MNKINFNQKVKDDFLDYAGAVIKSRAISSAEDNMKPVQRRILYTMGQDKLWPNKKTVKSANVIGKSLLIHPHGDSSIYDAMIRLAQPWKMRYPLVEVQGNLGSILGDGPAASRYTEARLSAFGELMLTDITKNAVPFKPTYDESSLEPIILPSLFPNILCNGNMGIAVGMSASLVPHNLGEVVDGLIALIDNKNTTIGNLIKLIPAPDFPTGGTITNAQKLAEIYETGVGTINVRAKYRVEESRGVQTLVFYEIPYLVNIEEGVIAPLKKLVLEEGFDLIDDYSDETNAKGVNLKIKLKKGANIYRVLETLWKHTRLQITQRINNTVIFDGNPRVMNLKELLNSYLTHRHNVIINVANYELEKILHKILITEGLTTALSKIDEVIEIIKKASNRDEMRSKLIALLKINLEQTNAILDMRLSRINKLDEIELKNELAQLNKTKTQLESIILSSSVRDTQIKKELLELKNKHKDNRRTTIVYGGDEDGQDMPVQDVKLLVYDTEFYITQREFKDLGFNRKNTPLNKKPIKIYKETTNKAVFNVFFKDGSMEVVKMLTAGIEVNEQFNNISGVVNMFEFEKEKYDYLVFLTKNGTIKKTLLSDYLSFKSSSKSIRLREGDELVSVFGINKNNYIYVLTDKMSKYSEVEVRATGRLTIGTKAANGDVVSALTSTEEEKILTINKAGQGKLTFGKDYLETAKGANGQVIGENTILMSVPKTDIVFIYTDGKNNIIDVSKISTKSKAAMGAKLVTGKPENISI